MIIAVSWSGKVILKSEVGEYCVKRVKYKDVSKFHKGGITLGRANDHEVSKVARFFSCIEADYPTSFKE